MNNKMLKLLNLLKIIPFYYITRNDSIYLYLVSFCLYNIFVLVFSNISILSYIEDKYYIYIKQRIFNDTIKKILFMNLLFVFTSIIFADITSLVFKIDHTIIVFLVMSLTLSIDKIVDLFREYILSFKYKKIANKFYYGYYCLDIILFIVIAMLSFKVFRLPNYVSLSMLYLSKMISFMIVTIVSYFKTKNIIVNDNRMDDKNINYRRISKEIFKIDNRTITLIFRNTNFYVSIMLLYLVLKTRYSYSTSYIYENIVFLYYYSLNIILFVMNIIIEYYHGIKKLVTTYLYKLFKTMFTISVILSVISYPLLNLMFDKGEYMAYLMWVSLMGLFMIVYQESFSYIKNRKVLYISLSVGLFIKIITLIPLVDSIYRMGYNLIYGDIISTILGFIISIIINYIYIRNIYKLKNNSYIEKIFRVIYDNLFLLFILLLLEFLIPIKSSNKLVSVIIIVLYSLIGYGYFRIKRVNKNG